MQSKFHKQNRGFKKNAMGAQFSSQRPSIFEEQVEFCKWWLKEVTKNQSPGSNQYSSVTDLQPSTLIKEEVEAWKVTVHRWNKYLEQKGAYRQRLLGAEYRA